jgi:hypothetical protein
MFAAVGIIWISFDAVACAVDGRLPVLADVPMLID